MGTAGSTSCTSRSSVRDKAAGGKVVRSTTFIVGAAVLLAAVGASLAVSLTVLALSPWVTVVGYELVGHRHNADVLAAL